MNNGHNPEKKKKRGLLPLNEKLGLGETTEMVAPPIAALSPLAKEGMFPGAAAASLENREEVGDRIRSKLKNRKGALDA